MKQILRNIFILLPLAALTVSCGELDADIPADTPSGETQPAGGTVFTAVISDAITKTVIGDKDASTGKYKVSWANGDRINVNGLESADASISAEGTASYSFGEEIEAPFHAVYPASAFKASEGTSVYVAVPSDQIWTSGTFDSSAAIMYASSAESTSLAFHHLMAYLKFSFSNESDLDNISAVTVKSRGTESLSGDFTLDLSSEAPQLVSASENRGSITVDCGEAGVALGEDIIVAVPAHVYASGLEVVTTDINGHKTTHILKREFTAVAGTVYPMPISYELYPGSHYKPISVSEMVDGVQKEVVWAPVYCGYSEAHPNGLLYQYGRAVGQPYYPAAKNSSICKTGPVADPADDAFYKATGNWFNGTYFKPWPMSSSDEGYVEGKIANPCPEGWRLPTVAEAKGLIEIGFTQSTSWTFTADSKTDDETNAKNEKIVVTTGFTLNGDSGLFFAAVGGRTSAGQSYYRGSGADAYARMWCCDLESGTDTSKGSCLNLRRSGSSSDPDGFAYDIYALVRASAVSVRCVKNN